jgi:hypothetical protein
MKIEFVEHGSADCPLIRIYGNEPDVCEQFRQAFEQLANGNVDEVLLTNCPALNLSMAVAWLPRKEGVTGESSAREETSFAGC